MVFRVVTTPERPTGAEGCGGAFGTVRHAGCFKWGDGDNFRKEPTMRLMQQTFLMTDIRKRVALLTLLSFVALC
jgi:hypothetical protein